MNWNQRVAIKRKICFSTGWIQRIAILALLGLATGCITEGALRPRPEGQVLYLGNDGVLRDAWGNTEILVDRDGNQLHIDTGARAYPYQERLQNP